MCLSYFNGEVLEKLFFDPRETFLLKLSLSFRFNEMKEGCSTLRKQDHCNVKQVTGPLLFFHSTLKLKQSILRDVGGKHFDSVAGFRGRFALCRHMNCIFGLLYLHWFYSIYESIYTAGGSYGHCL
uniref:Uncharacterized protein n=1 Tax=Sphaerodactylus townsendi TaxID=933632 RepID=A0ACB8FRQ6_9SAUR